MLFAVVVAAELFIYFEIHRPQQRNVPLELPATSSENNTTQNNTPSHATGTAGLSAQTPGQAAQLKVSTLFSRALGYSLIISEKNPYYEEAAGACGESPNSPKFILQFTLAEQRKFREIKTLPAAISAAVNARKNYSDFDIRELACSYVEYHEKSAVEDVCREYFMKNVSELTLSETVRLAAFYPEKKGSVRGYDASFIEKCRNILSLLALDSTITEQDRAMSIDYFR